MSKCFSTVFNSFNKIFYFTFPVKYFTFPLNYLKVLKYQFVTNFPHCSRMSVKLSECLRAA